MEGGHAAPGRREWTTGCATRGRERDERGYIRERERSFAFAWGREGGAERGWIKASTRGGNKERTKKVEEVGGGGWVPWSALIGSTWSDEKFNHPPIPTRPNSSSSSSSAPSPPPVLSTVFLSFSLFIPYRSLFPAA